ncbi:hypothetical protein Fcan01_17542 [Folsomia candida]|uniref:Uncharacterized protein n=1 Tax=Folsomia candida TaxID=158441 RepID=A0A226DPW1_FOLCA|nr:hypothetical protein Fcan01_17542 [Folsomia candida]
MVPTISKIPSKFKITPKLKIPTSYLPLMTSLIKWITRSYAIPIMFHKNSFSVIKGFNVASRIHYFTLFITLFYPIVTCVWFYVCMFSDKGSYSRALPVWAAVLNIYYFMCYVGLGSLQHFLHFRASDLNLLLKTTAWIEKFCVEEERTGEANFTNVAVTGLSTGQFCTSIDGLLH